MHRDGITEMRPPIAIDANHFARLSALSSLTSGPMTEVCEYLREELDRAHVLPAEKLRPDIVSLGSQVEFRDEQTGKSSGDHSGLSASCRYRTPARVRVDAGRRGASWAFGQSDYFVPHQNRRKARTDRAQGRSRRPVRRRWGNRSAVSLSSRSSTKLWPNATTVHQPMHAASLFQDGEPIPDGVPQ